jgi:membrane-bound lytic murein transglycosylase B
MYRDIVLKILDAIDYAHDKKEFADDFDRIISSQALVSMVQTLSEEKREEAETALASADSQEKFAETVKKYFTDEQVQKSLDAAAAQAITEWIKSVQDTLNDDQRQKLVKLSVELQEKMQESTEA